MYKEDVHHDLTYQIALEVLGSKCGGRGSRACNQYLWLAGEIARSNQYMDSREFWAIGTSRENHLLHFAQLPDILDNLRRSIALHNPTFFGSALHQFQDYFSHVGEGYIDYPLGHGPDEIGALIRRDQIIISADTWQYNQLVIQQFYASPGDDLYNPELSAGSREEIMNSLAYLNADAELGQLSNAELIDVWLREKTQPGSAYRSFYGYHTDFYYAFTRRDQAMVRGTRYWIERFFSGQTYSYPDDYALLCGFDSQLPSNSTTYIQPNEDEVKAFLNSSIP